MMDPCDARPIRCPRLGHEIAFAYCVREGGDLPCPRILRCWQPYLPVEAHLRKTLPPDVWERFIRQAPADKVTDLIGMIERAKRRRDERAASGEAETDA